MGSVLPDPPPVSAVGRQRIEAVVDRRDIDVVHIEQQPAARARDHLGDELRLRDRGRFEAEIGRRVLDQHAPAKVILNLSDVRADAGQRASVIRDRQQVVEKHPGVRSPGEMLGKRGRLVAGEKRFQSIQMQAVRRQFRSDRQTDAVNRQRIALADFRQVIVEGPAFHHVVLGVNLPEPEIGRIFENLTEVPRLESKADPRRQRGADTGCTNRHGKSAG